MVNFYINKIKMETVNASTGKPWTVEDVPKLCREKVRSELSAS